MAHPASRAARRALSRRRPTRKYKPDLATHFFNHKEWKLMYLRRNKLPRARQLGKLWPHPKQALDDLLADFYTLEDWDLIDPDH